MRRTAQRCQRMCKDIGPLIRLSPNRESPGPDRLLRQSLHGLAAMIRRALVSLDEPRGDSNPFLSSIVPWDDASVIKRASVDLTLSQAVLEYPPDRTGTYAAMERRLKPGGVMSHDIAFKSHGLTREWSGHWACSDFVWSLMGGRRRDIPNRASHSAHLDAIRALGFAIPSATSGRNRLPLLAGASRHASAISPTRTCARVAHSSRHTNRADRGRRATISEGCRRGSSACRVASIGRQRTRRMHIIERERKYGTDGQAGAGHGRE